MATTPPRIIDAHSLPHLKLTKAARACVGADVLDGIVRLEHHTVALVAKAVGVSVGYVITAQRLTPEEREKVRTGQRPLVLPRAPARTPVSPVPTSTPDAHARLVGIVAELGGVTETLNALAAMDYCLAA
jgi:hypothetical protein